MTFSSTVFAASHRNMLRGTQNKAPRTRPGSAAPTVVGQHLPTNIIARRLETGKSWKIVIFYHWTSPEISIFDSCLITLCHDVSWLINNFCVIHFRKWVSSQAVNGLFEGIASTMVLLYAFWSLGVGQIGDPPHAITKLKFRGEGVLVGALGIICFLSAGLGQKDPESLKRMSPKNNEVQNMLQKSILQPFRWSFLCFFVILTTSQRFTGHVVPCEAWWNWIIAPPGPSPNACGTACATRRFICSSVPRSVNKHFGSTCLNNTLFQGSF